jgi:hypothetical protein
VLDSHNREIGLTAELLECRQQLAAARAALLDGATMLNTIMERRDDELRGSAWGDVDNVRLDLARAAGGSIKNIAIKSVCFIYPLIVLPVSQCGQ